MSRIQQIFRDHATAYVEQAGSSLDIVQRRVIDAICDCRSGACGHHVYGCPDCGQVHVANSSCGNRHCPVCQHEKAVDWVQRRQQDLLPCPYFLATFTIPEGLRATARRHPRELYDAIMDQAQASLRTLEADPKYVGCPLAGFFGVLHTWGRQLQYHPHAHFVIPGGGLSADRQRWMPASGNFLVSVRALSRLFRGKLRARLEDLGLLAEVPPEVWQQEWVVHCKPAGNGRACMKYLGAYVFRVAIGDPRIVAYNGKNVTFKYQKVGSSRWRHMTVSAQEFIRRLLEHVLPPGFVKIRHFGFLSPNFSTPIQKIRELICILYEMLREQLADAPPPRKPKPLRCPKCRAEMKWLRFCRPSPHPVTT